MTHRFTAVDQTRNQETLFESTRLRKEMENIEFRFFSKGIGTWDDVVTARDEFLEAWEERRNFVLGEKYGMSREDLDEVISEYEENRG